MGELDKPLWAVISERGCEAPALKYAEALELLRRRTEERVSGLAIVTSAAASRFTRATTVAGQSISSGTARRKA
jgi:hypothetical protein